MCRFQAEALNGIMYYSSVAIDWSPHIDSSFLVVIHYQGSFGNTLRDYQSGKEHTVAVKYLNPVVINKSDLCRIGLT
jgi:hypothetical protein